MDEGSRIYLPQYDLPMHTVLLPCYPGTGWCANRDEYLGTAGDHGGQYYRWGLWMRCRMFSRGPVKNPHARVRWGERGMVTRWGITSAGVCFKAFLVDDHDSRRSPLVRWISLADQE
jgi:hypothetical protein